jgi:prepilin-type N-terminal cleavage/methylation domain-containing protein
MLPYILKKNIIFLYNWINNNGEIDMKSYKGFTLAEVLLTLTIIGVVAALVIPTLMNNAQQAEINSGVQSAYSMLSTALDTVQNNGMVNIGTSQDHADNGADFINKLCNVMRCVQTGTDSSLPFASINYLGYKNNGGGPGYITDSSSGAVLNNGMYIMQIADWGSCDNDGNGNSFNICGEFNVDINGAAGPNMVGYDVLNFCVAQNPANGDYSIVPDGGAFGCYTDSCSTTDGNGGYGCSYARLYNPSQLP